MSRLVSLCHPIGVKHADFADVGFIEGLHVGDLGNFLGENGRLDLRYIFGLISQTDEAIFPSANDEEGKVSKDLQVSEKAAKSLIDELGLKMPVYCPCCDPCSSGERMEILAGRSVIGEVEVDKGMVIAFVTPKNDPNTIIAWLTYNLFYRCTNTECGALFPIFFRDTDDKQALEKQRFLKDSVKTDFEGTCPFCGFFGNFDQYPMTNVGNFIWDEKFVKGKDMGDLPTDEMDIRYDWAVVCPKCRVLLPTARNEQGEHDVNRYKSALVTKPVPRVYQNRFCPVCDNKRKGDPLKVGMWLDIGNITHKATGQRLGDLFLDSFYVCDNNKGICESIFTLFPIEFLDYM
ncbi:MAG: hypothetical protein JSW00_19630 [Thermoplasmata archaeon]|nr:MAG: hypothetical protein JSW00_19630 [Thermoplasmata archaeon]